MLAAPNGAVLNYLGQPSANLFTLGSVKKGVLFETTAVPELRVQADARENEQLPEAQLSDRLSLRGPQERLLAGRFDPSTTFEPAQLQRLNLPAKTPIQLTCVFVKQIKRAATKFKA